MELSKIETLKALAKHLGYLFGGISLILMSLFMLGYIMDELIQIFGETTMPFLASLIPLVIMVTGISWGGYFISKGIAAIDIIFDLICKLADVAALNRMSCKAKVLIGTPPLLSGIIILAVVVFRTAILVAIKGDVIVSGAITPLIFIGLGLFFFGLVVTHGIKGKRVEQQIHDATQE